MPQIWNPNTPHTIGLEQSNQGISTRRIAGTQRMRLNFTALATEPLARVKVPAGPTTVSTPLLLPGRGAFFDALPDYQTLPGNTPDGVVCADIGPMSTAPLLFDDIAVTSIGAVMSGTDHRYSRNDNITGTTVGTGLFGDVTAPGEGNYLSDPSGSGHLGSSSFTFNTGAFPLDRHVTAIHLLVRSNGPVMATTVRSDPVTPTTWRSAPGRVFWDSKEFQDNLYAIGEMFVDNRTGTNEIWRLTPQLIRDFAVGGTRRFNLSTNAIYQAAPLVRVRIDYILMRVYYLPEVRKATGWVTKDGKGTLRVPSDVRPATDAGTTPAPYSKTSGAAESLILRAFGGGNIPVPSLALAVPRLNGLPTFSGWTVQDTTVSLLNPPVEPVTAAITFLTSITDDLAVASESQPYSATGGVFPYSGNVNGEKATTKNFPTDTTPKDLLYVLVSDSLGPKTNITFTLGSLPDTGGTTTSVTMTPAEIAAFPVVGYSTVSGSGTYGVVNKNWNLPPTVVRWRRVRVKFPAAITFSASGGRLSVKSVPFAVTDAGFVENYLVGALFPQSRGGLYPLQTLSADSTVVPVANTDASLTYASANSADLQAVFSTNAPVPTVPAPTLPVDADGSSHPRVTWTWAAGTGNLGAKRFELERFDTITNRYYPILHTTGLIHDDYEARFNTASTYRVRAVRTDGAESEWTVGAAVTPVIGICKLAFSSNVDPSINTSYVDSYSNSTSHTFASRDADSVEFNRVSGKDYEVAFRKTATGGVEFTRNVLLPTGSTNRPLQNVNASLLAMTRLSTVPYICVRDSDSNRWFASVTHTSLSTVRAMGCDTPIAVSALNIVEVSPSPFVIGL